MLHQAEMEQRKQPERITPVLAPPQKLKSGGNLWRLLEKLGLLLASKGSLEGPGVPDKTRVSLRDLTQLHLEMRGVHVTLSLKILPERAWCLEVRTKENSHEALQQHQVLCIGWKSLRLFCCIIINSAALKTVQPLCLH